MPWPTSLPTRMAWPGSCGGAVDQRVDFAVEQRTVHRLAGFGLAAPVPLNSRLESHRVRQSTSRQCPGAACAQRRRQVQRLFGQCPVARALYPVVGDAPCHFGIPRLAGGDVGDRQPAVDGALFRQPALPERLRRESVPSSWESS